MHADCCGPQSDGTMQERRRYHQRPIFTNVHYRCQTTSSHHMRVLQYPREHLRTRTSRVLISPPKVAIRQSTPWRALSHRWGKTSEREGAFKEGAFPMLRPSRSRPGLVGRGTRHSGPSSFPGFCHAAVPGLLYRGPSLPSRSPSPLHPPPPPIP